MTDSGRRRTDLPEGVQARGAAGYPVLPLGPDKRPLVMRKDLSGGAEQEVRRWQSQFRPAIWAIVTGVPSDRVVSDFVGPAGIGASASASPDTFH